MSFKKISLKKISLKDVSFKRIPWKSPQFIGGALIVTIVLVGSSLAFAHPPAYALLVDSNQKTTEAATQHAVALKIDGTTVAILANEDEANTLLQQYKDSFADPSSENKIDSVSFVEKVTIETMDASPSEIQPLDKTLQLLIDGHLTTKEYTVQKNDSWWLVARKNDMLTKDVLAGNPGMTESSPLKPGQVIKLVDTTPYLTVISKGTYTETQDIPYNTETKTDSSLRSGQTKVITPGSNGSKVVTYAYEQRNGHDVQRSVTSEQVTKQPVTQVVLQGPKTSGATNVSVSRGSNGSSLINHAMSLIGTPYVWGGTTQSGFDCSGFTQYVYRGSGISIPRTSYAQFASGTSVSRNNLSPGDLVFFNTDGPGASHVGIYIGGGSFVHAANPRRGVTTNSLNESYYASHYLGARRY
ncbi:hydrolase [Desulfitobacterium metallireducens DSM 15288]|uniref:Hydrolase n=1 Tax=Desulfitobacterium metallireducens DSM 15288 TaxID=871968 RepID=W0E8R4_9FIRM|nr:hydrolase [Desulfitobacterium metallireducens DSM 15288]